MSAGLTAGRLEAADGKPAVCDVGFRKQLFVDDRIVDTMLNLTRELGPVNKANGRQTVGKGVPAALGVGHTGWRQIQGVVRDERSFPGLCRIGRWVALDQAESGSPQISELQRQQYPAHSGADGGDLFSGPP